MRRLAMTVGVTTVLAAAAWAGAEILLPGADGAADEKTLVLGARLYQENCAACHGANRQGQSNWRERKSDGKLPAPPLDGSGHTWHHPDSQLRAMISQGVAALAPAGYETDMRGFGDELSRAQIDAILAYIKANWPDAQRERQAAITRQAEG